MNIGPNDAVLVIYAGGIQCALDLRQVSAIRGSDVMHPAAMGANAAGVVHQTGVRIPVYDLRAYPGTPIVTDAEAVIVLDLPDRVAAVLVDVVCEVRIATRRLPPAVGEVVEGARGGFVWIAAWEDGQSPVLDVTSWLRECEAIAAE
ncbi:MAG: chemotaxis protein CheW [Burkholderiales bacterium]|nr:chemotaxis protein CheW [Burkholderiales bacterium]